MPDDRDPIPLRVGVSLAQLDRIDAYQRKRDLVSREAAARALLDLGLAQADREPPIEQARELAERLQAEGHAAAAARLQAATGLGHVLLEGLREACQVALTTIEALDPKTALMAEELRLEVDKRLR